MKTYKTVHVPATTRQILEKRRCDLCGKESTRADWDADIYEVNETEVKVIIRHKSGENYPEGGSGEEYEIDICPECFVGKMVPWLKSEGAKIESSEWNW